VELVVSGFGSTDTKRTNYRNKFAGFWYTAHKVMSQVHNVKSHMTRAQAIALDQVVWLNDNSLADLHANLALPLYQELELDYFLKAHKQQKQQLRAVCSKLAAVEQCHPMAALRKLHPRTKQAAARAKQKRGHVWTW
jgi:hypothetical protein